MKNKRKIKPSLKKYKPVGLLEYLQFGLLLIAVFIIMLMFLPAVGFGTQQRFSGIEIAFGYSIDPVIILKFNFWMFLGYMSAIYMALVGFIPVKKHHRWKFVGMALVLFIASILLFTMSTTLPNSFGELSMDGIYADVFQDILLRIVVAPIFLAMNSYPPVMSVWAMLAASLNIVGGVVALVMAKIV